MKTASENLWNNINHTNIHIIGVTEGEERGEGPQKIFEVIIAENFPNLGKEQSPKSRKHKVLERVKPENTPKHTIIKNDEN